MLDPIAEDIFKRAWEKSRDREDPDVLITDIIEALLHRPMTVSLLKHFMVAVAIAEARGDDALYDQHLLLAMLEDDVIPGIDNQSREASRGELIVQLKAIQRMNREAAE